MQPALPSPPVSCASHDTLRAPSKRARLLPPRRSRLPAPLPLPRCPYPAAPTPLPLPRLCATPRCVPHPCVLLRGPRVAPRCARLKSERPRSFPSISRMPAVTLRRCFSPRNGAAPAPVASRLASSLRVSHSSSTPGQWTPLLPRSSTTQPWYVRAQAPPCELPDLRAQSATTWIAQLVATHALHRSS